MSLDAFKFIFWWEWAHRFLARMVGFAFAIPLVYFVVRRRLPAAFSWKLAGLFMLGGLQGAIGWYMVSSGLVDRIDVSHYRLALHLTVAFLILALLLWSAWTLPGPSTAVARAPSTTRHRRAAQALLALIFLQVVLGALVAGMKAGLAHNTWPLMDGQLIPSGLWVMSPWYLNPFENVMTVQFNHRMVAYVLVAAVLWHAVSVMRGDSAKRRAILGTDAGGRCRRAGAIGDLDAACSRAAGPGPRASGPRGNRHGIGGPPPVRGVARLRVTSLDPPEGTARHHSGEGGVWRCGAGRFLRADGPSSGPRKLRRLYTRTHYRAKLRCVPSGVARSHRAAPPIPDQLKERCERILWRRPVYCCYAKLTTAPGRRFLQECSKPVLRSARSRDWANSTAPEEPL